jgi:hypothetical protein
MVGIITLFFTLLVLYLLSRLFIQKLFIVLLRLTRNREKAAVLLGWLFLPGTFIHEVSHLLMALLLIVPVGKINLLTEIEGKEIHLGSVQIGKCDFFRGTLIGLAPLIFGTGLIISAISFALSKGFVGNSWFIAGFIFLIFELTHTMFSSNSDLKSVVELSVFVLLISFLLLYFKIFTPFIFIYDKAMQFSGTFDKMTFFLLTPVGLELLFLTIFRRVRTQ